jgi:putrescine transport system substrate-binding protein
MPRASFITLAKGSALAVTLLSGLLSCSRPPAPATASDVSTGKVGSPARYDNEKILNVYSWADYIAPDTTANFEKETGIKVRYDTFDNNEVLETKLLTGHTSYDVVVPTGNFLERQRAAGVYRPLDKDEIPNLANADPQVMGWIERYDPGDRYAVPYMWSVTGLGYNVDQVKKRLGPDIPDGWALLFDPKNAEKLKDCGITMVDSAGDVILSAIYYLGRDPLRHDPADLEAASAVLRKIRPFIRYIDPVQETSDLANGSVCLSLAWQGDVGQARIRASEAKMAVNLAFLVPREGALVTVDTMAIPADAPHPHNAQIWLNYLMRPDVAASITNAIRFPNGNTAALPLVNPDIRNDTVIYPTPATRERLAPVTAMSAEYARLLTREWTRFRTGY